MLVSAIIFFLALLGIAALFSFKYWEVRTERVALGALKARADEKALVLKDALIRSRGEIAKLPPLLLQLVMALLHELALATAALARLLERQAHRVAELISHKRTFQRRETKNEFLKEVSEFKNTSSDDDANV